MKQSLLFLFPEVPREFANSLQIVPRLAFRLLRKPAAKAGQGARRRGRGTIFKEFVNEFLQKSI